MTQPLKIGVLLSGSGTNLQAIIDEVRDAALPVDIVKVVSSRPDAYGIERAKQEPQPAAASQAGEAGKPAASEPAQAQDGYFTYGASAAPQPSSDSAAAASDDGSISDDEPDEEDFARI